MQNQKFWRGLIISLWAVLLCHCGEIEDDLSSGSTDENGNPPVGEVNDEAGFYVRVFNNGRFPYLEHLRDDFSSDCTINLNDASSDLDCVIDMPEGDTYNQDLTLQYNVPSSMCSYLRRSNYYYWNWPPGIGPDTVNISRTIVEGNVTAADCSISSDGGTVTGTCSGTQHPEVLVDASDLEVECIYDYSRIDDDWPNCCFGAYTLTVTDTLDSGTDVSVSELNWGGDVGACLGGPAIIDSGWPKNEDGIPRSLVNYVEGTGTNANLELTRPISIPNQGSTVSVANYFEIDRSAADATQTHYHVGYSGSGSAILPMAMAPIDDESGTTIDGVSGASIFTTQDSYEFECLDEGFEVIHRIRVYVREWNTLAEFLSYAADGSSSADPDVEGLETSSNCDYGITGPCNDFADWKDWLNNGPLNGSDNYDTTDPDSRELFFPREVF